MSQIAVIYARFSSAGQAEGSSLERQLSNGRKYVEKQGWTLGEELSDLARSAFHGANRMEGAELHKFEVEVREGLHQGKVLCVENLDRLSRQGVKAAAKLIWSLNEGGVDVATWQDGKLYKAGSDGDLYDIMYLAVTAQRAADESRTKSDRGHSVWESRYKGIASGEQGVRAGRPPAWLSWDGERHQPIPHRVAVLREIFDLYVGGMGTHKITQLLNERKEPSWPVKTKDKQKGWYLAYIGKLIRNRAVLGEYVTLGGELISTDFYPQVITVEQFTLANEIMDGRNGPRGRHARKFNNLLSGLPRCSECQGTATYENKGENTFSHHTLVDGTKVKYPRKTYERLRCGNAYRRKGCGNSELFDYRVVEEAVLRQLLDMAMDETTDMRPPVIQAIDEDIARVERTIELETQRGANIAKQMGDGSSRFALAELTAIEAKLDDLEGQLKVLQAKRTCD